MYKLYRQLGNLRTFFVKKGVEFGAKLLVVISVLAVVLTILFEEGCVKMG